jgi:hypothetical protein
MSPFRTSLFAVAASLIGATLPAPADAGPPCGRGWRKGEYCGPPVVVARRPPRAVVVAPAPVVVVPPPVVVRPPVVVAPVPVAPVPVVPVRPSVGVGVHVGVGLY